MIEKINVSLSKEDQIAFKVIRRCIDTLHYIMTDSTWIDTEEDTIIDNEMLNTCREVINYLESKEDIIIYKAINTE